MFVGLTALEFATLHGALLESLVEIPADTPIPGVSPLLSTAAAPVAAAPAAPAAPAALVSLRGLFVRLSGRCHMCQTL
jgi:hypothetical protein